MMFSSNIYCDHQLSLYLFTIIIIIIVLIYLYALYFLIILFRVHQKFLVPGSLLVNSDHHQHTQNSEYTEKYDGESLIEPSLSIESTKTFGIRNRDSKTAVA